MADWQKAQQEFENIFALQGKAAYVFRVTDSAEVNGMNSGKAVLLRKQPSDYIVTHRGEMFYAEVKSSKNPRLFPFGQIEAGQWNGLGRQLAAGGAYYFFVHSFALKRWFKIPGSVIRNTSDSRVSMRWDELQQYRWELAHVH